jgi:hypothetical protein
MDVQLVREDALGEVESGLDICGSRLLAGRIHQDKCLDAQGLPGHEPDERQEAVAESKEGLAQPLDQPSESLTERPEQDPGTTKSVLDPASHDVRLP